MKNSALTFAVRWSSAARSGCRASGLVPRSDGRREVAGSERNSQDGLKSGADPTPAVTALTPMDWGNSLAIPGARLHAARWLTRSGTVPALLDRWSGGRD